MSARTALDAIQADVARKKTRAIEIRGRAAKLFREGRSGIQIAEYLSQAADELILEFVQDGLGPAADQIARQSAVVAVGGTGRGDLAPYSDIDLLFLESGDRPSVFRDAVSRIVQSFWDAKLELGHSVRTVGDCVSLARQDAEIATALTEARFLWGSRDLFDSLKR